MNIDPEAARNRLESEHNLANKIRKFRTDLRSERERRLGFDTPARSSSSTGQSPGRPDLVPGLPAEIADEIRRRATSGLETQAEIAADYGVSQASVSYHKRKEEEDIREAQQHRKQQRHQIREVAIDKLMLAMNLISKEKLEDQKASTLAGVATKMAQVIDYTTPKNQPAYGPALNVVVYSPTIKPESEYQTVEIKS